MQTRYLGDSHDFAKYALLRHLHSSLGVQIGINWYLTDAGMVDRPEKQDGEKRHHLKQKPWRGWEPDLREAMAALKARESRSLANLYALSVLPRGTVFFEDLVSGADRKSWGVAARRRMNSVDLVFLDPDNGFEVPSMTRKTAPKYALYEEAALYAREGKIVVTIQFARQCDPIRRGREVRDRLSAAVGRQMYAPIVRARLAPNLLFITIARPDRESEITRSMSCFAEGREKIELIY